MKVAVYYNNKDLRIEERPVPAIGEGEILIKTRSAGICGSDVAEWYRAGKVGRVLGHEIAGEIAAVGPGVTGWKEGDAVTASHHVPCFQCHYCRLGNHTLCDTLRTTNFDPGGFSEWIRLPAINVRNRGIYPLSGVSFEEGTFVEPLACTLRAQRKANVRPGQTVLVVGSGTAGLLHIQVARALGARKVLATDVNEYRMEAAKKFGAHHVFRPDAGLEERIRAINDGRLPDVVIACVGNQMASEQALKIVERGGTVLFFALNHPDMILPFSLYEFLWKKGATLLNSYAAIPEEHLEALELIRSGRVNLKPMITHRLPFEEIGLGFELVVAAQNSLKVMINL